MTLSVVLEDPARHRLEALFGEPILAARDAPGGYSATRRLVIQGARRSAFAKLGMTAVAARMLRREAWVYERLHLASMPEYLGWEDHAESPILLLSDLSQYEWPPPWTVERSARVLECITELHRADAPLRSYAAVHGSNQDWWRAIADDPGAFLALEIRSQEWLERNLQRLREFANQISGEGDSVTHFDLRSDNICLGPSRVFLVDWSHACRGNARLDLGLFLPGWSWEGGPGPEEVLPDAPDVAAWVAGFLAVHAAKAHIPTAPGVRRMQRSHLRAALPWAERALDLRPDHPG